MKTATIVKALFVVLLFALSQTAGAQKAENWTADQLLEPQVLAEALKLNKNVPVIISVGPGALIPGSIAAGPVDENQQLPHLAKELKGLGKDTAVVVYCGCCPFEHCPNVRPAIDMLRQLNFTNYKLLNLPRNIKADWLDKGYPRAKL